MPSQAHFCDAVDDFTPLKLPHEVWAEILAHFEFDDMCAFRASCRAWKCVVDAEPCDKAIAKTYAERSMGDSSFWQKAMQRPAITAKPLPTFFAEICRIERFRRGIGISRLAKGELYNCWAIVDSKAPPDSTTVFETIVSKLR